MSSFQNEVQGALSLSLRHTHARAHKHKWIQSCMHTYIHKKQNVSIWSDQFKEHVVYVCFNTYAFEPASWQKTAETASDIMEGTLMTYLEYERCSPGTSGRLESLPDYHAEPALSPLAFPVASGLTCPLLPVSPINNYCVEKVVV